MSDKQINDGGPAFPIPATDTHAGNGGMTLRDFFAAFALAGQVASMTSAEVVRAWQRSDDPWGWPAESAYRFADSMLAERRKGGA